ncbi:MAG TPA: hypothetical protein VMT47_06855 [Polyangia bacterium]|nr:hypothetical protein [Polyangia bacterium]
MTRALSVGAWVGLSLALAGAGALTGACNQASQPAAPPPATSPVKPPEPTPPKGDAGASKPKMIANPDGLSLAERIAKREAAEKKVAADLAVAEHDRLVKYDRGKLPLHVQTFTFITKTRGQYDALEKKLAAEADKTKAKVEVEKLAASLRPGIVAAGKKMATIDPKGGNSNVTTDYDVMLNALANDYPDALIASIDGAKQALGEQKAELDKREKKITAWIGELKAKK